MANVEFNSRIRLKYDTLTNWTTNKTKVLLEGEVGLCYVPGITTGTTTTAPIVLFKVGDGKSTWEVLPWGSGLAADVYDWAKKESPDYADLINKPTIPSDTDTQYKLEQDTDNGHILRFYSKTKEGTWQSPVTITIPDNDHNNNQTVKVGTTTFGADDVVELVAGSGVTLTPSASEKKITIAAAKASSAATADSADKVAHALTLKAGSNSKMFDGSNTISFEVTAADLGLGNALHFIGVATVAITEDSTIDPKIDGYTFANAQKGDVVLYNHTEFVWDGAKWEKLGDDSSYALKTITATATDDGVVILTGTNGSNGVTYDAKHVKKGPTSGATKGPSADVTISGYGGTGSIKVPKVVVDEYGHTTGLTEQTLAITMPAAQAVPSAATAVPSDLGSANVGSSTKYAKEDHVHKMPVLNEISVNTSANYVIFNCGSSTVNI